MSDTAIDIVIAVTARHFSIDPARFRRPNPRGGRPSAADSAQRVAMWLARRLTNRSYHRIGAAFRRDGSTVSAAVFRTDANRAGDPGVRADLDILEENVVAALRDHCAIADDLRQQVRDAGDRIAAQYATDPSGAVQAARIITEIAWRGR